MSGRQAKRQRRAEQASRPVPRPIPSIPADQLGREDEFRARLLQCASDALTLFYSAPDPEHIPVAPENVAMFYTLYPLACHVIEQVRSAIVLIEAMLPYPAEANARSGFQHAITVQWMLLTRDSHDAVVREMRGQFDKQFDAFASMWEVPGTFTQDREAQRADLEPESEHQQAAKNFKAMCELYSPDGDESIYLLFRYLSGSVHPSLSTLLQHYQLGAGTEDNPRVWPAPIRRDSDTMASLELATALALSAVFAVNALETLRIGQPRLEQIRDIAIRYGVPPDLAADRRPIRG